MCVIGSVIVHIMTPQMRSFYKIEKRWKDAEVPCADKPMHLQLALPGIVATFIVLGYFIPTYS